MPRHLLATAAPGCSGCFAAVTVAGVVEGPPDVVWQMLAELIKCGVFSDVKSAREVRRSRPRLHGRHLVSRLELEQVARVNVLKVPLEAAMRVQLDCNHTSKQVQLHLLQGNKFLRSFEGVYAVLPIGGGGDLQPGVPGLPPQLAAALGPECSRQLAAKLETAAAADSGGGGSSGVVRQRQLRLEHQRQQQQRSLVILHQRMQPAVQPPPGMGGFVRGQVRQQFEHMFGELQATCQAATATSPRLGLLGLADRLRSNLSQQMALL